MPARPYIGLLVGAISGDNVRTDVIRDKLNQIQTSSNVLVFQTAHTPTQGWLRNNCAPRLHFFFIDFNAEAGTKSSTLFLSSVDGLVVFWDGQDRVTRTIADKASALRLPLRVYFFDPLVTLALGDLYKRSVP